jgi:hypothetical protein
MDELIDRLEANGRRMAALRGAVEAGEPWPLSAAYGAEPESDWGPNEVLAHVAEMLVYWLGQIERILGEASEPVPFGRVASDSERIARIGRDRAQPAAELFDRIAAGVAAATDRARTFTAADAARRGQHTRLGEMTVESVVERFIVGHLDEHVRQLEEILAARSADGTSVAS